MTPAELARLFVDPAGAGRLAQEARAAAFGRRVVVRAAPAHAMPAVAAIVRGVEVLLDRADGSRDRGDLGHERSDRSDRACADEQGDPGWPAPSALQAGDRVVVQVDRARLDAYLDYLGRLAAAGPPELALAPVCARPGGLFRLHLIAAARVALPGSVRVEARHDLLGIRLAQVALAFGADTLAGPVAAARRLPLAGVPRPDEATPTGLAALVERAGLEPVLCDLSLETLP